nr:MAG TPA: hypothetical protein [Caudoviricetes sp.]
MYCPTVAVGQYIDVPEESLRVPLIPHHPAQARVLLLMEWMTTSVVSPKRSTSRKPIPCNSPHTETDTNTTQTRTRARDHSPIIRRFDTFQRRRF